MPPRNSNWCRYAFVMLTACSLVTSTRSQAADSKPAVSQTSVAAETTKKKPHLSPQATQGPKPEPSTPPKPEEIKAASNRGIKFLLADQRPDGSWGSPERSKGMN